MAQRNSALARLLTLLCVLVFGLLRCSPPTHARKKPPVYDDPEGYAVLSLLLGGGEKDIHSQAISISAVTAVESPDGGHTLEKCVKVPNEFREAADNYVREAKTPYLFQEKFTLKTQYRLVAKRHIADDLKHPPKTDKEISDRISSGTFYLSPVGFDHNHTHAIAFKDYICGSLCGWGSYHLLVKSKDGWEEAKGVGGCWWQY